MAENVEIKTGEFTTPEGVHVKLGVDKFGQPIKGGKFLAANEKLSKTGKLMVKCQFCGKWITKQESVDLESGSTCLHQRKEGLDDTKLAEHRKAMTAPVPPDYATVADVHRALDKAGVSISKLVKAFGGDRCLDPQKAAHPTIVPIYSGKNRWIHKIYLTPIGIKAIATGDFSKINEAIMKKTKK